MPRVYLNPGDTSDVQVGRVDTPIENNDATNKSYVDALIQNIMEADERIQFGEFVGTNLRLYHTPDATDPSPIVIPLADLADFPFVNFTTVPNRDAGLTTTGQLSGYTRPVFATVLDDSATGDGSGSFATYVLTDVPASGAVTDDSDWNRISSPDTIINEVCLRRADGTEVSIGTTSDTGGLTETQANRFYFRQDNRLSELIVAADPVLTAENQLAARTNLDVSAADPFDQLPHASDYVYTADAVLTGNLRDNTNQDFQNILGFFLAFDDPVTDVPQGSTFYIFSNGNSATGTQELTIRRNAQTVTNITGGVVLGFDVYKVKRGWINSLANLLQAAEHAT